MLVVNDIQPYGASNQSATIKQKEPDPANFQAGKDAIKKRDYPTAYKFLLPFAEKGNADAQFSLGLMYSLGNGVPQNNVKALMWFALAKENGHPEAAKGMEIIKRSLTSEEIAEVQRMAKER